MTSAAFLVDTGPEAGLGHLRRSCVLLDAMAAAGYECRLLCADTAAAAQVGRAAREIPASPAKLSPADVIVCDSYRLPSTFIASLRARSRVLVAFDDTAERDLDVDIVLNHNIYGDRLDYSRRTRGQVLAGSDYTLVDPRILAAAQAYRQRPAGTDVVISFGGTDDGARGAKIAEALLRRCGSHIHIVVAPGKEPAAAALELAEAERRHVSVHPAPDMAALLSGARVYVGGAGVTALEALVVGLDLVLVVLAPNQQLNAEAMAESGQAVIAADDPEVIATAAATLLGQSHVSRPNAVDGHGPGRVIAAIELLLKRKSSV